MTQTTLRLPDHRILPDRFLAVQAVHAHIEYQVDCEARRYPEELPPQLPPIGLNLL